VSGSLLQAFDRVAQAPGGVARLRELILSLAVRGKLVRQDPNEEPASVLLQRIRAEKDRLLAEGKIKRDKPLPPIAEDEILFELPRGWEWARIPDISFSLGQVDPVAPFSYIDVAAIDNLRGVVAPEVQVIAPADAPSRARKVVQVGTVLYSTVRPYLKNIAIVERDYFPEPIASTAFAVMHPHTGVDSRFLLHYLRSLPFTEFVNAKAVGVAYPAINDANFFQGIVPLPATKEQQRIVARVDELMRLCDALEAKGRLEAEQHTRLLDTLLGTLTDSATSEELTANWQRVAEHFDLLLDRPEAVDALEQTVLQLAVRGLLVPQDPDDEPASVLLERIRAKKERLVSEGEIKRHQPLPPIGDQERPFELPQGWEWARLGVLANFIDYRGKTPVKTDTGIPLITAKNVRQGYINREPREFIAEAVYESWMTRGFPKTGDLLFTTEAPLGNVATIDIVGRFALAQRVICFGLYELEISGALCTFIQSPWMQEVLSAHATGVTAQGIKSSRLQMLLVPIPPLREQSRIFARVTELRRLCADLRKRLTESHRTRSILADALVEQVVS
jgi:type I restriction enzyme S subunit